MMSLTLYPLSNYSFGSKDPQPEEDSSVSARLVRLQKDFELHGIRHTTEGLLLVHEHGHPHVLLLQVANAFFKLPGDYLKPDEPDIEGLKTALERRLGSLPCESGAETEDHGKDDWEVGDLLAQWWRPNFESFMFPYCPAHISNPKEVKSIYLIQLPEQRALMVGKNMKLLAIPLFELYDNAVRYGPLLAAVPHLLSKYKFIYKS